MKIKPILFANRDAHQDHMMRQELTRQIDMENNRGSDMENNWCNADWI